MITCLREVQNLIQDATLTAEARLSIFPSGIGEESKLPAVERICAGRMSAPVRLSRIMPDPKVVLPMRTRARLLVNHGGGVLENANLCLHPHFGCPFIPGSAVKGIARHEAWCQWDDARKNAIVGGEDPNDLAIFIVDIFGFPTRDKGLDNAINHAGFGEPCAGSVAFLPAFPAEIPEKMLEPDILNSHERRDPVPVYFPAVRAGSVFEFVLVPGHKPSQFGEGVLIFAVDFLRNGLANHGIGAKTRAGYGWFEEVVE